MADGEIVWVACSEDCEQGALGLTGERAWKAGVPKPLFKGMAEHLTNDPEGTFKVVADPHADTTPEPTPLPPLSDEALMPPAQVATGSAVVTAEGSLPS